MSELKNFKNTYLKYLVIFPIIIVLFIVFYIRSTIDKKTLTPQNFYQYIAGQKVEYSGEIVLDKNDNISELQFNDVTIELDSTPIYYENDNKLYVIFPENMNIVFPNSNSLQYLSPYFTTLYNDAYGVYREDGKSFENCFFYDFDNLYFFIDQTILKVGEIEYQLEPFSYAIVTPRESIEIYDRQNGEYYIIDTDKSVIAMANGYEVDLNVDAVKYGESQRLLIKNKTFLKNID